MKKQNLAYLMTLTVLAAQFAIPVFSQVYGEEGNELFEAYEQETDIAENSVEDLEFVPEEEIGLEEIAQADPSEVELDDIPWIMEAADEADFDFGTEIEPDGLIEEEITLDEIPEDFAQEDPLLFAADGEMIPVYANSQIVHVSGSRTDYLLNAEGTGEFDFIGTNIVSFSIYNKDTEEEVGNAPASIDSETLFCSAQLSAGTAYVVRVTPKPDTAGSFYCYQLPRYCVVLMPYSISNADLENVELADLELRKKIFYNDKSSFFETDLKDEWNYCESEKYYFRISSPALDLKDNGNGTSSIVFANPEQYHAWDNGKVVNPPTCTTEGLREYSCICEDEIKTESIPKVAHSWTAYNANGDRTCSVCGTTEHDASMAVPAAPVYEIEGKPTKVKAKADGSRKLTVSWKKPVKSKMKKIAGYYIEVATDENFTNIVRTRKVKKAKTSFTFKRLNKKQKYYVRVRFYKGSQISMWSAVKGRKVK